MAISSLDRKLLRDLWRMRGQALAIALVIGAGVAMYLLMLSTFESLQLTLDTYYERQRFGDVFASLKRAPWWLADEIAAIPNVADAETRVVVEVTIDVPDMVEPASGRLISVPADRRPKLNDLFLRKGRWLEPGRSDEVLASESFAAAHGLGPGDTIAAIINGRRRELEIVGLALSPEYIYQIRPGELLPDEARFGVFWMERRALATAFDMEGGFNDVVLSLMHGASEQEVIARLDELIEPYGGFGAIPRSLQSSHWYLMNELKGLQSMGAFIPMIFLGVAAFLLNVVLSRIVSVQREQIAVIKALGYSNSTIGLHYAKWAAIVAVVGAAIGLALGIWFGKAMTEMYTMFFHFPILLYHLEPLLILKAIGISLAAALIGALSTVRQAVTLPPAEAMRPEPPAKYGVSVLERTGLRRWLSQPTRIILRTLQRHPGRAALSVIGIAFGGALLVLGTFSLDAMDEMMDLQYNIAQRWDVMVTFVEPTSSRVVSEIDHLPGVMGSETFRSVPVRLRHGHISRQTAITGVPENARLNRVVDTSHQPVDIVPGGLILSAKLAEILAVEPGDTVRIEVLEGARPVREAVVISLVNEYMGTNAYMELGALNRLMREDRTVSGAYLMVDDAATNRLYQQLKETPRVAGVLLKLAAVKSFEDTLAEMMAMIRSVTVLFAAIIAFGVVYNAARISLSERSRELATLRIIGFTRAEISYILLGELAVVTALAVPLSLLLGRNIAAWMVEDFDTELWRMPLVIEPRTYAFAAVVIVIATAISALIVRRKLDRLDLVEALKTRE